MRFIQLNHMRRGGGHAIIRWVVENTETVELRNNVRQFPPTTVKEHFFYRAGHEVMSVREPERILWSFEDHVLPGANVTLVRSAYNMFASRMALRAKRDIRIIPVDEAVLDRWCDMAEVKHGLQILYDNFLSDPSYRKVIAAKMGLRGWGLPRENTRKPGQGSSFEDDAFNERYLDVDLPDYVLRHTRTQEINHRLFGWYINSEGKQC